MQKNLFIFLLGINILINILLMFDYYMLFLCYFLELEIEDLTLFIKNDNIDPYYDHESGDSYPNNLLIINLIKNYFF